jgi:hypothetical protein
MSPRPVFGSRILLFFFLYDFAKACTWFLYISLLLYDIVKALACNCFLHITVFVLLCNVSKGVPCVGPRFPKNRSKLFKELLNLPMMMGF